MICRVLSFARMDYGEAQRLQQRLCGQRLGGDIPDILMLLEHPPTITVGKSGKQENILVDQEGLASRGVSLFFTDRGGDVTYHGPGQLVVYPILDLRSRNRDVHAYVQDLEEVLIRTLAVFGVGANRNSHSGVWVGEKQIAAIGIAVKRWVTMHGIALNVTPQQEHFRLINPCGLAGIPVTSVCEMTGKSVSVRAAADVVINEFASVFGAEMERSAVESLR